MGELGARAKILGGQHCGPTVSSQYGIIPPRPQHTGILQMLGCSCSCFPFLALFSHSSHRRNPTTKPHPSLRVSLQGLPK